METIVLHNVDGISRLTGTDANGCVWIEFEADYFAEKEPGTCSICGDEIESGWLCLGDSSEVCAHHVEFSREDVHKNIRAF